MGGATLAARGSRRRSIPFTGGDSLSDAVVGLLSKLFGNFNFPLGGARLSSRKFHLRSKYVAAKSSRVTDSSERPAASRRRRRIWPHSAPPTVRDFAADWKRWSVAERILAAVVLALLVPALVVAAALIGH
jgi:hypothetical protein